MGAFLSYSIVSGLILLAMFLVYRLLLAAENQHAYNRGVILAIYAISFLTLPAVDTAGSLFSEEQGATVITGGITATVTAKPYSSPVWSTVLIWTFFAGIIVCSIKTLIVWIRIIRIIADGEKTDMGRYTLVLTDNSEIAPFSWMHYMVMSRADYESCGTAISAHELRHIECRHWIDLLIAQFIVTINWFNPAAWLMRDELMLLHEYQADMAVIDSGHNPKEYQMLLIKKAVGTRFPSLANSLNHNKLKKRIIMMRKSKSSRGRRLKVLALVPAMSVALMAAAMPQVKAAIGTIKSSEASIGKDSESRAQKKEVYFISSAETHPILSKDSESRAQKKKVHLFSSAETHPIPYKGSDNSAATETAVRNFTIESVSNEGNKTVIVVRGENLGSRLNVAGGKFSSGGKTYDARSFQCEMSGGAAVITTTFPFVGTFDKASLSLNVNGNEITIDFDRNFSQRSSSSTVTISRPDNRSIGILSPESGTPAIFIDGQEKTHEEMNRLNPDDIEQIKVDKKSNTIHISLKK